MANKKYKVAVIDFETDPFEFGADIQPFVAGFFDGTEYRDFWGDDCQTKLVEFLHTLKTPHYIYAHNGGKFDFMFLLRGGFLDNPLKIINGRIVSVKLGIHTLRDSYAILPVPLKAHQKEEFDYSHMKKNAREKYRKDILHYLASDCENLFSFVMEFIDRFGMKLTAASMAYSELKKFSPQVMTGEGFDSKFREFYYGGRVECFEKGIIEGNFKVFDVNSMYPYVMANFNHPKGADYVSSVSKPDGAGFLPGKLKGLVYFARIRAVSLGALPIREKTGISFPASRAENSFMACSHEIQAGIETGKLSRVKYDTIHYFKQTQNFSPFVTSHYEERLEAKASGDKTRDLLVKLILNSSSGKFAMNPREFWDYEIVTGHSRATNPGAEIYADYGDFSIWRTRAPLSRFNHVAIAASITSAARATLLRGISKADRAIYCDTDSLICAGLDADHSGANLGAWKLEGECSRAAIGGKKMYALFNDAGECVKMASKGVRLAPEDILRVCRGEVIHWQKESPAFSLSGATRYIERDVRMT